MKQKTLTFSKKSKRALETPLLLNDQTFDSVRQLADQGDPVAQFQMGFEYQKNFYQIIEVDEKKAVAYYQKSAEQGNACSQYMLSLIGNNNPSVLEDSTAEALCQKAINSLLNKPNDVLSVFVLGSAYALGKGISQSDKRAYRYFLKGAKNGHSPCQCNVGLTLLLKNSLADEALEWLEKSANQNNMVAIINLAKLYEHGYGPLPENKEKAFFWYLKAAEKGLPSAEAAVGFMYGQGIGTVEDQEKSIEWSRKAAEKGNITAQVNLVYKELTSPSKP